MAVRVDDDLFGGTLSDITMEIARKLFSATNGKCAFCGGSVDVACRTYWYERKYYLILACDKCWEKVQNCLTEQPY